MIRAVIRLLLRLERRRLERRIGVRFDPALSLAIDRVIAAEEMFSNARD